MPYLCGSIKLELTFCGDLKPLVGYINSDWVGDFKTCRSTSGYLFYIGSKAISWSSKKQPIVSLSSCEIKYVAQTQATKKAI